MFFDVTKRRANGVKQGKCPYCGKYVRRSKIGEKYFNQCGNCCVDSYSTQTEYYANYFVESEPEKVFTEKISLTELRGDWYTMPDRLNNTLKYLGAHGDTVKITAGDTRFGQMISDGKKLINNICPICNGEIKEYSRLVKGYGENVTRLVRTGYNELTFKNEYSGTYDTNVRVYRCPQKHGGYELYETDYYGIYRKRYCLKSVENLTESQKERLYKAAAFSNAETRNKYWQPPKKG